MTLQAAENPKNELLNAVNGKYYVREKARQTKVFQTIEKQAVVAVQQYSLGRVGVSLIPKTYLWALGGSEADYENFWSKTIENIIVNYTSSSDFILKEQLSIVDFPLHFRYQNQLKNEQIVWQNPLGETFELASSELEDEMAFVGKFWQKKAGWHRLYLENKQQENLDFYVYKESNWQAFRIAKKAKQTASYLIDNQRFKSANVKAKLQEEKLQAISLFWFYIAFFISLSALWISEKFML